MNQSLETFRRLYASETEADKAISGYNKGKKQKDKQLFLLHRLSTEQKDDNIISWLNKHDKCVYVLPGSVVSHFGKKPGEYSLPGEVMVCNKELGRAARIIVTAVKFIINAAGEKFICIDTRKRQSPMMLNTNS